MANNFVNVNGVQIHNIVVNGVKMNHINANGTRVYDAVSAPVFTTQPSSVTNEQAPANVTFTVAVNWNGETGTLQWYRGDTALAGQTGTTYSFTSLVGDHNVPYKCIATNSAGSATSSVAYSWFHYLGQVVMDATGHIALNGWTKSIIYYMVAGGGGGGGGYGYGSSDGDGGGGAGGGGAGQYKQGTYAVPAGQVNRLFAVIGAAGSGGLGGYNTGPAGPTAYAGTSGTNTDLRLDNASGQVLAWAQGGNGGQPSKPDFSGGAGGNDGDGNAGGNGATNINTRADGGNGTGRAGGGGGNWNGYGGAGGYADPNNGGGHGISPSAGGIGACGGGGGVSASASLWGGTAGHGGSSSQRAISGKNWSYAIATSATGYGHGGGGGHKGNAWDEMIGKANGGNGSRGRLVIDMYSS